MAYFLLVIPALIALIVNPFFLTMTVSVAVGLIKDGQLLNQGVEYIKTSPFPLVWSAYWENFFSFGFIFGAIGILKRKKWGYHFYIASLIINLLTQIVFAGWNVIANHASSNPAQVGAISGAVVVLWFFTREKFSSLFDETETDEVKS